MNTSFYGGFAIQPLLAKLFTAMFKVCHISIEMKMGNIFTVFKGGNKDKKDPNSYRAQPNLLPFKHK